MKFTNAAFIAGLFALSACGKKDSSAPAPTSQTQTTTESATSQPATAQSGGATISGVIKFTGTKPTPKKISMNADQYCKTQHTETVNDEEVVVNPNNTLKFVYVYVKSGLGNATFPPPTTPAVLDQNGCQYKPHVLAVQVGQDLVVRNSDGVLHNVNARPKTNKGFNFGQPVKGMETKRKMEQAEVMIPVKCDVHPWMHGYIGVQNHPFAAVSDDQGAFSLQGLPPGTYEIEAWHEKYGTAMQTVTVTGTETKTIEFTFKGA